MLREGGSMKIKTGFPQLAAIGLILLMAVPPGTIAQEMKDQPVFKQEELDQMLAPIALYPDSLLAQVLMASTYPLEVVQADRWVNQNKELKGDALAEALEKQDWDPSVKSLVQFPDVLAMMGEKLDWTQKLGDAFLSQQEDVTSTVQNLRKKAEEAGNLKSSAEQKVVVEKETQTIIIEPAKPDVVYVPMYNPTVVYGTWWWPSYPPYYYYPPYYPRPALYGFAAGVAIGVAWGYAWGHWNWHHHHVSINVNRNININRHIDRKRYVQHYGRGDSRWQHRPEHRKGVSYRDQRTARQFNRASSPDAVRSRENFRGRAEAGRRDLSRGGAEQFRGRDQKRPAPEIRSKPQTREQAPTQRTPTREMKSRELGGDVATDRSRGGGAFSGMNNGKATRDFSNRGSMSRSGGFSRGGGRGGRR